MLQRSFFLLLALILLLPGQALPCGIITHGDVSERGSQYFKSVDYPEYEQYLLDYPSALQAGSHFPDWGYFWNMNPESDYAHSMSFMRFVGQYIYDNYPKPWGTYEEKLATFFLGIVSHNEADDAFHTRSASRKGFLEIMSNQNFHGGFTISHGVGDTGGDAVLAYGYDMNYIANSWWVPNDDIADIYTQLGYANITPSLVRKNLLVSFIASRAELFAFPYLISIPAITSTFLFEQWDDYFIGGMDDMTYWVTQDWAMAIDWMENGLPSKAGSMAGGHATYEQEIYYQNLIKTGYAMIDSGELVITEMSEDGGTRFTARINPKGILVPLPSKSKQDEFLSTGTIFTEDQYSYLGSSFAVGDFDNDGESDLAIGAPGYSIHGERQLGAVYVLSNQTLRGFDPELNLTENQADAEFIGDDIYGRFGWALTTVDLNKDGIDDLAISAPTTGAENLAYQGKVYVYFGNSKTKGLSSTPDIEIGTDDYFTNLGYSLAAGDLDGDGFNDLVLGNPFDYLGGEHAGSVAVFASSQNISTGTTLDIEDAAFLHTGENNYDWYGYHVGVEDFGNQGNYLLVSAPSYNDGDKQSVGKLYGYPATFIIPGKKAAPASFTITGQKQYDKTGSSFAVFEPFKDGKAYLAFSSPTRKANGKRQAGSIDILPVSALSGDMQIGGFARETIIEGSTAFARFGWSMLATDVSGDGYKDLWITEPYRATDAGADAGGAYLFVASDNFPTGKIENVEESANVTFFSPNAFAMLGNSSVSLDVNSNGFADTIFGARRYSNSGRLAGAAVIAWAPIPEPTGIEPATAKQGMTYEFFIEGSRFVKDELTIEFRLDDQVITLTEMTRVSEKSIGFLLEIPADAPEGNYDLTVTTILGKGTMEEALTILSDSEPDDDDDNDDSGSDDDDDTVEDDDDDTVASSDDDDDDEGCGC